MENIKKYIFKYKTISLIVISVILIILMYFLVSQIIKTIDTKNKEKQLKNEFNSFAQYIKSGKSFEANMMFADNSGNELLKNYTKSPEISKMLEIGYVNYIQSVEHMIVYYKKINIEILKINKMNDDTATITVQSKKLNYLKYREECYSENADNPDFDYNKELITKFNDKNAEYITGDFEINLKKVKNKWRLIYDDQMRLMIYGESN